MMKKRQQILIVDDDRVIGETLKLVLSEDGYDVVTANTGNLAVEQINKQSFNVVVLDLVLPDIGGIELLRMFSRRLPEICFIISTGFASLASAIEALKAGAYDYIIKPFDVDHVKLVIKRGIERQKLAFENIELVEHLQKERNKLAIILQANSSVSNIVKLEDLADFVTAKAVQIIEAEKSSLLMVDEALGELVVKGSKGIKRESTAWRIKIGELIAGWVAKQGKALLVEDIANDPRFKHFANRSKYKTKSFISLPLKTDSRIVGVINVSDKLAGTRIFTQEDLRYLKLLAHQAVAQIENIRLCEKLSSLAVTDSLTNIFNHRYFQEQLDLEIKRAVRYKHPLSLAMFDIDSFKAYNDHYGHLVGDMVLRDIASLLKQSIRQVDIASRYGGEEFMIILPEADLKVARVVAERIRKAIQNTDIFKQRIQVVADKISKAVRETGLSGKQADKGAFEVTVSGGVASYRDGSNRDEFVSWADQAMYKAKAEGKNRICVFE